MPLSRLDTVRDERGGQEDGGGDQEGETDALPYGSRSKQSAPVRELIFVIYIVKNMY